ncbi:TPA: hypothetical protein ACKRJ1_001176 [Pseudomonas aeruginosa]
MRDGAAMSLGLELGGPAWGRIKEREMGFNDRMDDDGFSEFLSQLLGQLDGPAEGITRQVIDKGLDSLSAKQKVVFDRDVMSLVPGKCSRGCDIPWSEKYEAIDNGGLCSWCAKMKESADKDD